MKFHEGFLRLIDSPVKQKIVKFLLKHESPMSEREISSLAGISHMSVNRILREMEGWNLVYFERVGLAHVWKVNRKSYVFKVLSSLYKEINSITPATDELRNEIIGAFSPKKVVKIILFGSVAKGNEDKNSDIDIFILVKNKTDADCLESPIEELSSRCLEKFGNRLTPYVLTQEEYKKNKNPKLMEAIEEGIQLLPGLKNKI